MTTQEIIDELNAGRLGGFGNWRERKARIFGGGRDIGVSLSPEEARREAEAIRRKRREINLEPIMPLLEAIVFEIGQPHPDESISYLLKSYGVTEADVRKVVAAWKARRE